MQRESAAERSEVKRSAPRADVAAWLQFDFPENAVRERARFVERFFLVLRHGFHFVERRIGILAVVASERDETLVLAAVDGAYADRRGINAFRVGGVFHDGFASRQGRTHASTL